MTLREQLEAWLEWCDRDEEDMGGGKYLTPTEVRDMLKEGSTQTVTAEQVASIKAEAWDQGYWDGINGHTGPGNPYREPNVVPLRENEGEVMNTPAAEDEREVLRRVLEDAFWPFLAHDPSNPDAFWGGAVDRVIAKGFHLTPRNDVAEVKAEALAFVLRRHPDFHIGADGEPRCEGCTAVVSQNINDAHDGMRSHQAEKLHAAGFRLRPTPSVDEWARALWLADSPGRIGSIS